MLTIEFHLALLALTALALVMVLVTYRRESTDKVSLGQLLWATVPVLVIGVLCSLLMLAGGKPLLEWLLPLAGVLLIGWLCGHGRLFRIMRIVAPIVAALLSFNFLVVAHAEGVTNAPRETERFSELRKKIAIDEARKVLLSKFDATAEFPAGPVRAIVPNLPKDADPVVLKHVRPEWHSFLSHLYRVETNHGTVWYPGGALGQAVQNLEVRDEMDAG